MRGILLTTLVLIGSVNLVSSAKDNRDYTITPKDKAAIKKFLPMVEDVLTHDYMREPYYLARWIKVKKYDLEGAADLLKKNIEWRKENKMDELKHDTTSSLAKEFPVEISGVDKQGRAVQVVDWTSDVRKVMVAGKRKQLAVQLTSAFEFADRRTRELNNKFGNKNITNWIAIYDFNKFTTTTHLCVQCLTSYLDQALALETKYPYSVKEFHLINTPRIFLNVLRLVTPILGDSLDTITTYGNNRAEWKAALLDQIDADQLPKQFGGTKVSKVFA